MTNPIPKRFPFLAGIPATALLILGGCDRTGLVVSHHDGGDAADSRPKSDAGSTRDAATSSDASLRDASRTTDLPPPVGGTVVTFQIDPAHTGGQPLSRLRPPLQHRWSVTLGTVLSYPLIVGDSVFVTGSHGLDSAKLYALSAVDGTFLWGPVELGVAPDSSAANAAWDAGKIFTMNSVGTLSAFDAITGTVLWSRRSVGEDFEVGAPVAANGRVYVASGPTMTVLDENTGITLWTNNYAGSPTSAAYTPDIVVLEYLEGTISALDPASGLKRWQKMGSCVGGGGEVPVIYQGRIYARDYGNYPNVIYDLKTGDEIGYFNASTVPAFENGMGFFLNIGTLEGHDLSGTLKWTFVGDGNLSSTPMAAGGAVYIGSTSGSLFAVDEKTGTQLWEEKLDAPIEAANEMDGLWPTVGLGASYDLLVVPASGVLAVYGN